MIELMDIYRKDPRQQLTEEELMLVRKHTKRHSFKAMYCTYNRHSHKNTYIGFFIDQMALSDRRSPLMNIWDKIAERPLTLDEYNEITANYGCHHKRFIVYMYRDIEALIVDDLKYGVETPAVFVDHCRKKGYSGQYQLQLFE